MSDFHVFGAAVEKRWSEMSKGELYEVDAVDLWSTYLAAFPEGTNPVFRTRTEHDCSCCKNFIRNVAGVVGLAEDGSYVTIWGGGDMNELPEPYLSVAARLDEVVRQLPIKGVFRTKMPSYGAGATRELLENGGVRTWNHFHAVIAPKHLASDPEAVAGRLNTSAQVNERSLRELTMEAVDTVLELIQSDGLYRGAEHLVAVQAFVELKRRYDALQTAAAKSAFAWGTANGFGSGFRNTVIGTLASDLSNGADLEDAVRMFESKVAPQNYKRPKAVVTQRMVDEALGTIRELGLEAAIERRHAKMSDVSVTDVIWVDGSARSALRGGLDALLSEAVTAQAKTHARAKLDVQKINIDEFIDLVVPRVKSASVVLEPRHQRNLVSLTAPVDFDAYGATDTLFRWRGDLGWSYNGDVTDSVRERVKAAGGDVDAPLRVSLAWYNTDDLDLHAQTPNGEVAWHNKMGVLDVDMNVSRPVRDAVENLSWRSPRGGHYSVFVHQYNRRERADVGFEVQFHSPEGTRSFSYDQEVYGSIGVIEFDWRGGTIQNVRVSPSMREGPGQGSEFWGVKTGVPTLVKTLMLSPNHADPEAGHGAKHWFFVLDGCLNPDPVRGIYNEFLRPGLLAHKRVFELLGSKAKAPFSPDQMSGVGFTKGRDDSVLLEVRGDGVGGLFEIVF